MIQSKVDQFSELIGVYLDLFEARSEVYAIYKAWHEKNGEGKAIPRKAYVPSTDDSGKTIAGLIGTSEWGEAAARAHVGGDHALGVYPIDENSNVKFFCLDFDGKNGDPWEAVKRQQKIFSDEAGLVTYIERSRSGEGYHLWGFLSEPTPANKLNRAVRPFIERVDVYDRMVPMQDGISEGRPFGNLIALPLFRPLAERGKNIFVTVGENGEAVPVRKHLDFFKKIERNPIEKIYELFANAPDQAYEDTIRKRLEENEGLSGSYKLTHPVVGCEWIRWCYDHPEQVDEPTWYALACQFAQLKDGRELFHKWSAQDKKRYTKRETDHKFDQALDQNKPHRCDTIREQMRGVQCQCDTRFPDIVKHPYDLVKVPFERLLNELESVEPDQVITPAHKGLVEAFNWAKDVHKNPEMGAGLPWGLDELDASTGLRDSDLIILAARPGIGKTAFALDMGYRIAKAGTPVYFFSLEMSESQLWKRMLARAAQVSHGKMSTGKLGFKDWRKLHRFNKQIDKARLPFYVDDMSRSTQSIIEVAGDYISKYGKGVIFFDYLQLAKGERGEPTYEKVSRVTNDLKMMAKFLQVPVVALAQLNRAADDAGTDADPVDAWLKGSGEIEQTADVILFLLGKKGPSIKERTLVIHKERHRESGVRLDLDFNQPLMTFGPSGLWSSFSNPIIVPASTHYDQDIMFGL